MNMYRLDHCSEIIDTEGAARGIYNLNRVVTHCSGLTGLENKNGLSYMERLVDVKNLPTISPRLLANVPLLPLTGFVHQILSSSTCLTHTCS